MILSSLPAQIMPPSGVTHCATAFFTHLPLLGGAQPNLLLARSTHLDVYALR